MWKPWAIVLKLRHTVLLFSRAFLSEKRKAVGGSTVANSGRKVDPVLAVWPRTRHLTSLSFIFFLFSVNGMIGRIKVNMCKASSRVLSRQRMYRGVCWCSLNPWKSTVSQTSCWALGVERWTSPCLPLSLSSTYWRRKAYDQSILTEGNRKQLGRMEESIPNLVWVGRKVFGCPYS